MPIDFHSPANSKSYNTRRADQAWSQAMQILVDPHRKKIVDVGSGGGIYSRAWAELGARQVTGVDFSDHMVHQAARACYDLDNVSFRVGDAVETGLLEQSADIVFNRAVIHHLDNLPACFREAYRLLNPGGVFLIQDRTMADIRQPASTEHIRGYFFEQFPGLFSFEEARRPEDAVVREQLAAAGFEGLQTLTLWETRRTYVNRDELAEDLRARTGRSILHELSGDELEELVAHILGRLPKGRPVKEKDRWTIWVAKRPDDRAEDQELAS